MSAAADSRRERAFERLARRHRNRNYAAHLIHGLFGQTGMRLVNAPTFLPAYVYALSGAEWAVGLARGLQHLGMFLSPIVAATWIEHRNRVLPVGLVSGALLRLALLGLALGGLLLPAPGPLVAVWLCLGLFGFFLGVQGVVMNMLVAKVIPLSARGRWIGLRNAFSGVTATAVALWAGVYLVERNALGNGYAVTFLVAFVLTSTGLAALLWMREPASPRVLPESRVTQRLSELPALLRGDPDFARYFAARALAVLGRMGVPLYVIYAGSRFPLDGGDIGWLTGAFVLAQNAGNLGWGALADGRGFRLVFLASLGCWIACAVALIHCADPRALVPIFAGIGLGMGGFQMSAQNLVLEFGRREELPLRIAVANSASDGVAAVGVLAGGLIAQAVGQLPVLWIAVGCQALAFALVAGGVREPRRR